MRNASKFSIASVLLRPFMVISGWCFHLLPWMINCREFNDSIYDYVEDDLSDKQLTLFNRHKRACPICRNFLKTYTVTQKAQGQISPYSDLKVDERVPQDLHQAIFDVKQQKDD